MSLDLEHARRVVQLLAHVLPDTLECEATAALGLLGLVADLAAGKVSRECSAAGLILLLPIGSGLLKRFELNADRLEVLIDRLFE
jgi:hypothetical protein